MATTLTIQIAFRNVSFLKFTVPPSVTFVAQTHRSIAGCILRIALSIDAKVALAVAIAHSLMLTEFTDIRVPILIGSVAAIAKVLFIVVVISKPKDANSIVLAGRSVRTGIKGITAGWTSPSWLASTVEIIHCLFFLVGACRAQSSSQDANSTILALKPTAGTCCGRARAWHVSNVRWLLLGANMNT